MGNLTRLKREDEERLIREAVRRSKIDNPAVGGGSGGPPGPIGPAGPAPAGTGFVRVTGGVLDLPTDALVIAYAVALG